jgi:hypothetical protein
MDTYEGSPDDPVSLHRYLYTSSDPVNGVDPTGKFDLGEITFSVGALTSLGGLAGAAYGYYLTGTIKGAAIGGVATGLLSLALLTRNADILVNGMANATFQYLSDQVIAPKILGEPPLDSQTEQMRVLSALAAGELNPFIGGIASDWIGGTVAPAAVGAFANAFLTAKLQGKCWQSCIAPALTSTVVTILVAGPLKDRVAGSRAIEGRAEALATAVITGLGKTIGTLLNTNLKGYLDFFDPSTVKWL